MCNSSAGGHLPAEKGMASFQATWVPISCLEPQKHGVQLYYVKLYPAFTFHPREKKNGQTANIRPVAVGGTLRPIVLFL